MSTKRKRSVENEPDISDNDSDIDVNEVTSNCSEKQEINKINKKNTTLKVVILTSRL